MKTKDLYVVIAYRWGDRNNHSYPIGVFDKKGAAIDCADEHTAYRGGKYSCSVEKCALNAFDNDNVLEKIYESKSINM